MSTFASQLDTQYSKMFAADTETEQDPMVLAPHVLSLPSVCGKTLAKE